LNWKYVCCGSSMTDWSSCCFLNQYSHEGSCTKDLNTSGQCLCSTDVHFDASFGSKFLKKNCTQILPFKTANIISDTCLYCKKLQKSNKSETENTCTVDNTKQDIQSIQQVTVSNSLSEMALPDENDVTLCENDDNDMSIILNKIFPDCPDKMKTFLFSQKMALERHPNGRRWNRDIVRSCLSLWCKSPHGYTDLRNSKFVFLPSQQLLQRYKNQVDRSACRLCSAFISVCCQLYCRYIVWLLVQLGAEAHFRDALIVEQILYVTLIWDLHCTVLLIIFTTK
jgi:hypothetical protein